MAHFSERDLPTRFPRSYDSDYKSYDLVTLDVNGDGFSDLFISNRMSFGSDDNEILLNDGNGNFQLLSDEEVESGGVKELLREGYSTCAVVGDFDGDGSDDLFLGQVSQYTPNSFWFNNHNGIPGHFHRTIMENSGQTRAAVAFDADMDGDLDVFVVNYNELCELLINDGSGSFTSSDGGDATSTVSTWTSAVAADFDGDGAVDLFVSAMGSNDKNMLLLNNGDGTFVSVDEEEELAEKPGFKFIGLDIDGDGDGTSTEYCFHCQKLFLI